MKQFNTSILKVRGSDGQFKELSAIAGTIADDSKISSETTWSSEKLVSRFASKPQKIADSLYLVEYSGLNPDAAEDYFTKFQPTIGGACSSMHNGNFYGRNYDWSRNHQAVFVVHVPSIGAKHASYGMAAMTSLTTSIADTGVYDNRYEILPFITLDGINDAGVVCNTNVVPPNDRGATTGSNPGAPSLCALAVPRFILDNASSAAEAVEMLRARNIYSARYDGLEEEYHFMIGDAENTYIVEFNNNEIVVVEDQHIMTNFFNYGFDGNTATAFYKSEDFDESTTTLTAHPMGLERYDILAAAYDTATSVDAMHDAMKSVWYTKAYDADAETPWYSEYCYDYGTDSTYGDLDISRPAEDYEGIYNLLCERFAAATRDTEGFWETVHSTVYDIEKRQLNVWVKEEDTKYCFSVEKLGQEITTSNPTMGGADWLAAEGQAGYIAHRPGESYDEEITTEFVQYNSDEDSVNYYLNTGYVDKFAATPKVYINGEEYSDFTIDTNPPTGTDIAYISNLDANYELIDNNKYGVLVYFNTYSQTLLILIHTDSSMLSPFPTIEFKYIESKIMPAADWNAIAGASTYIANKPTLPDTQNAVFTSSISIGRAANTGYPPNSIAIGSSVTTGMNAQAFGSGTTAGGYCSHAEGYGTTAISSQSHAEGYNTTASSQNAHAEGNQTTASGDNSHAEGYQTTASQDSSHAEGYQTQATYRGAHAEGNSTQATATAAHAEGDGAKAKSPASHAEGTSTEANSSSSHVEGEYTYTNGTAAHAEGVHTRALSYSSHAEGYYTETQGNYAHAEGEYTLANQEAQHVSGKYNIVDTSSTTVKHAVIVGNGTSDANRSNAYTLDWNGKGEFAGDVIINAFGDSPVSISSLIARIEALEAQLAN